MSSNTPRHHIQKTYAGKTIGDHMRLMAEVDYKTAVKLWQRSLKPADLASMEQDYKAGMRDEMSCDAHEEYLRRRKHIPLSRRSGPSSDVTASPSNDSISA